MAVLSLVLVATDFSTPAAAKQSAAADKNDDQSAPAESSKKPAEQPKAPTFRDTRANDRPAAPAPAAREEPRGLLQRADPRNQGNPWTAPRAPERALPDPGLRQDSRAWGREVAPPPASRAFGSVAPTPVETPRSDTWTRANDNAERSGNTRWSPPAADRTAPAPPAREQTPSFSFGQPTRNPVAPERPAAASGGKQDQPRGWAFTQPRDVGSAREAPPTRIEPTPEGRGTGDSAAAWRNNGGRPASALDRFRDRVMQDNRQVTRPPVTDDVTRGHPGVNVRTLDRDRTPVAGLFDSIRSRFGDPRHQYQIVPRHDEDFRGDYRHGGRDGRDHHIVIDRHVTVINLNFFYGHYCGDPFWPYMYYPGYYPSIYSYYGWSPRWIFGPQVVVVYADPIYNPPTPYRYYQQLDERGVAEAQQDIQQAWETGNIDPLTYRLRADDQIRVYFDGKYEYSLPTDDYYTMTLDALSTTRTESLDFDPVIWLSTHEVFFTGRHVFTDPEGQRHVLFVSYRLRLYGGQWYIAAVGSSPDPIQHEYRDFRY
jgi:hypothetical protein